MKNLQRLQQHILATDPIYDGKIAITARAGRLQAAFRRCLAVSATATALGAAGTGLYIGAGTGAGTFDARQIFFRDGLASQRMVEIYDTHRALMVARERVNDIKRDMIEGVSSGNVERPLTLEEQAVQLRAARTEAAKIAQQFTQQTHGLSPAEIQRIVVDDDSSYTPSGPPDDLMDTLASDDTPLRSTSRMRP